MTLFVLQQLLQRNIKSFDIGSHSSIWIIAIICTPIYLNGASRNHALAFSIPLYQDGAKLRSVDVQFDLLLESSQFQLESDSTCFSRNFLTAFYQYITHAVKDGITAVAEKRG